MFLVLNYYFVDWIILFRSTLQVFELKPDVFNASLDELVMFLAQVIQLF